MLTSIATLLQSMKRGKNHGADWHFSVHVNGQSNLPCSNYHIIRIRCCHVWVHGEHEGMFSKPEYVHDGDSVARSCLQDPWSSSAQILWTPRSSHPRCSPRILQDTGKVGRLVDRTGVAMWLLRLHGTSLEPEFHKIDLAARAGKMNVSGKIIYGLEICLKVLFRAKWASFLTNKNKHHEHAVFVTKTTF